jgi:adenosine 3'-phospho 5'-phosphosulfate transporter B2
MYSKPQHPIIAICRLLLGSWKVRHPEVHMHVVIFSVGNTIGQIFIFQTIRSFGAVVFAIVMNTRIILSILFSCLIYHHKV